MSTIHKRIAELCRRFDLTPAQFARAWFELGRSAESEQIEECGKQQPDPYSRAAIASAVDEVRRNPGTCHACGSTKCDGRVKEPCDFCDGNGNSGELDVDRVDIGCAFCAGGIREVECQHCWDMQAWQDAFEEAPEVKVEVRKAVPA